MVMKNLLKKKTFNIKSIKIIIFNKYKIYINKKNKNIIKYNIINKNINILINKNKNILLPIYIIHINKYIDNSINNINIVIKKNNNIFIIEEYIFKYKKNKFINYNYNLFLNKNTKLNYILLINLNKNIHFIYNKNTILKRKAKYKETIISINAKKIFLYNKFNLYKYTYIKIKNISIIKKKNFFYYKTYITHISSESKSYQKHKNIILSSGIVKFITIINILKKSYNTIVNLKNNNLCFNNPKLIISKPQLNILNYKNKCKHQININKIDKKIIFYLFSRGLNKYKIKKILNIIFIKKIINIKKYKYINNKIYKIIFKKI